MNRSIYWGARQRLDRPRNTLRGMRRDSWRLDRFGQYKRFARVALPVRDKRIAAVLRDECVLTRILVIASTDGRALIVSHTPLFTTLTQVLDRRLSHVSSK